MGTNAQRVMPSELGDVFEALRKRVIWLNAKWNIFCQLFASSQETVDLLNCSASTFFAICEDMMISDILLTLGRLTDPRTSAGRDNLSLNRLLMLLDTVPDQQLKNEFGAALNEVNAKCAFARAIRNRKIAHLDLGTHLPGNQLTSSFDPLPDITKGRIEEALQAIAEAMNTVEDYYTGAATMYIEPFLPNGATDLIARLRDAEIHRSKRTPRFAEDAGY